MFTFFAIHAPCAPLDTTRSVKCGFGASRWLPGSAAAPARALAILSGIFALTGCVARGYKFADKTIAPATALNFPPASASGEPGTPPGAEVVLRTVIVYQGPGSWKREAYWDEYVVLIANRGDAPLTLSTVMLHNAAGESLAPGDDPWKLDRLSKTWWQSNAGQQTKTYLALGAGTVGGAVVAVAGALSGGIFGPVTSAGAAAIGVGSAVVVALPLVAVGTVAANVRGKHRIEAEFSRRRLALPLTLAPGQRVEGSFFFRIAPAPRRLAVHGRAGDEPRDIAVDLGPIGNLHLKLPVTPVPAASPTPSS